MHSPLLQVLLVENVLHSFERKFRMLFFGLFDDQPLQHQLHSTRW